MRSRAPSVSLTAIFAAAFLAAAPLSVGACGGKAKEPEAPAPEPPPEPEPPPPPMAARSELGTIDENATEGAFKRLELPLQACHRKGLRRVRSLGGDVQFFLRVSESGTAKFVFLMESTLGDRETERCMLDAVARGEWPKPRGGEAEVKKKLGFDPPADARRPIEWPADKLTKALHEHGEEARRCKTKGSKEKAKAVTAGDGDSYYVTMYIAAKGARRGRVQAVGVSPPSPDADEQCDCIATALKTLPVPSPGKGVAKVSFVL